MHINLDEKKAGISYSEWLILILVLSAVILRIYILYLPFNLFGYLVPPGDDPVNHLAMVKQVLSGNFNSSYPLFFHAIIAFLSKLFSSDPLATMRIVTPILVIFPPLGAYFFAVRHFGKTAALLTFFIFLWACDYALVAFGDGNYPNLLAAGLFMPLALLFVVSAVKTRNWINYLGIVIFTALIAITHQLTAVLFAIIVIVYLAVIAIFNRFEKLAPNLGKTVVFAVIVLVLASIAILASPFRTMFTGAFASVAKSGAFSAGVAFNHPIELSDYAAMIGGLVWYGGLMSLISLFFLLGQSKKENKPAIIMLLTWFFVAFMMSRTSSVGLPGRFARETAMPLVLSLGFVLSYIIAQSKNRLSRIILYGLIAFVIYLNLSQINDGVYRSPEFFNKMIWFDQMDKEKTDFIKSNTSESDVVMANQTTPYFPIFSERKIVFADPKSMSSAQMFNQYLKVSKAKYIFIGTKTSANPGGGPYPFFTPYDESTKLLKQYVGKLTAGRKPTLKQVYVFPDGSVLYLVLK